MQFAKRMDVFTESIFSVVADRKRERLSTGLPVIDLSIGSPNIPPAPHIRQALLDAASQCGNYVYAINDLPELREAAALWYERRYGVTLDPQREVTSLMGSQDGLAHISLTVANEGDTILVPDPGYPIFSAGPKIAGAKVALMPLRKENGYLVDFAAIDEETARAAKLMILSYPGNPVTAMAPVSFFEEAVRFAKKYDIIILHDNAYSDLVFDSRVCGSFLSVPGAKEVGIEFNSLSKSYGMAGCRMGFALGNEAVVSKLRVIKSQMDFSTFLPIQHASIAALTGPQECVRETCMAYQRRRDRLVDAMTRVGWPMEKCEATMYIWAPIPPKFTSSMTFFSDLLDKAGIACLPGIAFGERGEGFVRLALVQDEDVMEQAAEAVARSGLLD